MRSWIAAGAFLVLLTLGGCDYGPADVGYRPPSSSTTGQASHTVSESASSGTSNGGDITLTPSGAR